MPLETIRDNNTLHYFWVLPVGKTALGSTTAIALGTGAVKALRSEMQPNQVTLVIAPPHLIEKWKREILSIHANAYVERLDRHEERSNSTESKGFAGILRYRTKYVYKRI
jgi:hypothetical protein